MKERAIKQEKLLTSDNRTTTIKYVKPAETSGQSSQKYSPVTAASATRPSERYAASCHNLAFGLSIASSAWLPDIGASSRRRSPLNGATFIRDIAGAMGSPQGPLAT